MLKVSPGASPNVRQPIFNLPPVVTALAVAILAIHAIRVWILPPQVDFDVLNGFAFVPERFDRAWTWLTYAFLHADWTHAGVNVVWMAAFASPLAIRFGPGRFVLFSVVGAVAGALVHMAANFGSNGYLIGASAMVAAHMGGTARFAFAGGGLRTSRLPHANHRPAPPLMTTLRNRSVLAFLGIWIAFNLLIGVVSIGGRGPGIAWEAHIGGLLAGLLLFPRFDPVSRPG